MIDGDETPDNVTLPLLSDLLTIWRKSAGARGRIQRVREYADGDQISEIPSMPEETADHYAKKPRFAANLLSAVLDKLSGLYDSTPHRSSDSAERWRDILWRDLDIALAAQDRELQICGTSACVLIPSTDDGPRNPREWTSESVRLTPYFLPSSRFVALSGLDDPNRPRAVLCHWRTARQEGKQGITRNTEIFYYFDDLHVAILHDDEVTWSAEHGYGTVPVAILKNSEGHGIYGKPIGGPDLIDNCDAINAYFREVVHTARLQRGQPYVKGTINNGTLGPDTAIEVDANGDFGIVSNAADLAGMVDVLEKMLAAMAVSLGAPRGTLQLSDDLDLQSDAAELSRYRRNRSRLAQRWEHEIHRVARHVWRSLTNEELAPLISVEHTEQPPPQSVDEMLAIAEFALTRGLRSEMATARSLFPYMTDQALEAMVSEGLEAQARRAAMQATIAGHARDVDGSVPAELPTSENENEPND